MLSGSFVFAVGTQNDFMLLIYLMKKFQYNELLYWIIVNGNRRCGRVRQKNHCQIKRDALRPLEDRNELPSLITGECMKWITF